MQLFKAKRDLALVAIAVLLVLCLAIIYQELEDKNGLSHRHEGYIQYEYGAGERVALDVLVNWDRGLVPETQITSHVPGPLSKVASNRFH
jgi:hypothetical protein